MRQGRKGARIAVQLVMNYEEGAEANVLDGEPARKYSYPTPQCGRAGAHGT